MDKLNRKSDTYQRFFSLNGIELAMYVTQEMARNVGPDFIQFFQQHRSQMDPQHLEMAIHLLGKTNLPDAAFIIVDFIDEPIPFILNSAIGALLEMDNIPGEVLSRIINVLLNSNRFLTENLIHVLEKAVKHPTTKELVLAKRDELISKYGNKVKKLFVYELRK